MPEGGIVDAREVMQKPDGVLAVEMREKAPRGSYIKKEDAEKHCYTKGRG